MQLALVFNAAAGSHTAPKNAITTHVRLHSWSRTLYFFQIVKDPNSLRLKTDIKVPRLGYRFFTSDGGGRRDRTDDLLLAKQALSQLSYAPVER